MFDYQCEIAVAVADTQSFSEAAYITFNSLSTVSRMVQALEKKLGVKLFYRNAKAKVCLTSEGEALMPYIRSVVEQNKTLLKRAEVVRQKYLGNLSFGYSSNLMQSVEAELINEHLKTWPDATFVSYRQSDDRTFESIRNGSLDFGLSTLNGDVGENTTFMNMAKDKRLIVLPIKYAFPHLLLKRSKQFSGKRRISIEELKTYDMEIVVCATYSDYSSQFYKGFVNACNKYDYSPRIKSLNMQIAAIPEILSDYVSNNENSAALVHNIYPRRSDCVKIQLADNSLSYINFMFYSTTNDSVALKRFVATAQTISQRNIKTPIKDGGFNIAL